MGGRDFEKMNRDDLTEAKSLVKDAKPGPFTLEDILAEYGTRDEAQRAAVPVAPKAEDVVGKEAQEPDLPWPEAPRRTGPRNNVVAFPGGHLPPEPEEVARAVRSPSQNTV